MARRLAADFAAAGKKALLRDASLLPNYKKKLEEGFDEAGFHPGESSTLILDNVDFGRDERLIKEVVGTNCFDRIVVFCRLSLFSTGNSIPIDQLGMPFKLISLSHLHRSDIRTLATQLFETSDEDAVSAVVEQVYRDLVTLCIPLTPSNVVMYLRVLFREGEFYPLNRVQIVNKYLTEILRRPSDAYRDAFSAKNKMDVLSAFVFDMFSKEKTQIRRS